MLGILAGIDQKVSYALFPGKAGIACDNAPRAVFSSLVHKPLMFGIMADMNQRDSCPRRTGNWIFWEMTSMSFCIQRSAWFDQWIHALRQSTELVKKHTYLLVVDTGR